MLGMPYDALGTFLVFLIGVPALVIQSMDAEVRRAVMKRSRAWRLVLRAGGPLLIALLIIVAAISFLVLSDAAPAQTELAAQYRQEWVWSATLFVLTFWTAIASILVLYEFGIRDRVISGLVEPISKRLQKDGQVNEEALDVLVELGEQSQAGEDRQMVIEALGRLVRQTRTHTTYRGDSLEPLIDGLKNVLVSDSPGNPKNFRTALVDLQEIVMTPPRSTELRTTDLFYALRALSELSRAAMANVKQSSEIEHMLIVCAGSLQLAAQLYPNATTEVSQVLFEMGIAAMAEGQTLAAMAALDKLFGLIEANPPASGELVADTLGLASHFWVDGETARQYVEEKLALTKSDLAGSWRKALEAAQEHCAKTMQFKTADNLGQMITSRVRV